MIKDELIERSPVRFFEKAINGGLKAGEIGVLTSKKGLGKTSVLVQIGIDQLLKNNQVVHVSFNQKTDFVMSWYQEIFAEISKRKNATDVAELTSEIMRKRIVLNFNQDNITANQIVKTLKALEAGGIKANCLLIDGLDFAKVTEETIKVLKDYAAEANAIIWFSCNVEDKIPEVLDVADVVVSLEQKTYSIQMKVSKVRGEVLSDQKIKLDSKTLLMSDK